MWGPRKAESSLSNLAGSYSVQVATNSTLFNSGNSNEKEVKKFKLPLNSLDNITRPLTCPASGCQTDFKSFSGFVLHIENHSCMSSMCATKSRINLTLALLKFSILSLHVAKHEL